MVLGSWKEFNPAGCSVVLLFFISQLLWSCIVKSVGILLPTLTEQFTTHTWVVGSMVSLMTVMTIAVGPGAAVLDNAIGSRCTVILSCVMISVGLLLVPMASSFLHIAATLVLLCSPGYGLLIILGKTLIARHFRDYFALAYGIGHTGNAVAFIVFAPLTQLLLDTYGWRGATRWHILLAGICMHSIAFGVLVREATPQYGFLPDNSDIAKREKGDISTCCFRAYKGFDLHILIEFNFLILFVCRTGITFSYYSWLVYYVPHLEAKGFLPQAAAALCITFAIGYLFGSVICSPIIDRGLAKCSSITMITSLLLTMSLVVDPWVNGIWGTAAITFLFGLSVSAFYTLLDVFTKELFPPCRLTSAFGWIRCAEVLPVVFSGFLPGWVYETVGNYDVMFIVLGIAPTLCLLPMIVAVLQRKI